MASNDKTGKKSLKGPCQASQSPKMSNPGTTIKYEKDRPVLGLIYLGGHPSDFDEMYARVIFSTSTGVRLGRRANLFEGRDKRCSVEGQKIFPLQSDSSRNCFKPSRRSQELRVYCRMLTVRSGRANHHVVGVRADFCQVVLKYHVPIPRLDLVEAIKLIRRVHHSITVI